MESGGAGSPSNAIVNKSIQQGEIMHVVAVVGARPNFMKIAPIAAALQETAVRLTIIHTGQHYDHALSQSFFEELSIPRPDMNLEVGSGSHAEQTAAVMLRFEKACIDLKPDRILVVGDVNSTLACSLVAAKLHIPVDHVEAGLRSFDRRMPEEVNRVVTDVLSDYLLTTGYEADENLKREGIPEDRIIPVGNTMIDTLLKMLPRARRRPVLQDLNLVGQGYVAMTLHRPSNVDDKETLTGLVDVIDSIQQRLPVVFPIHPRTRKTTQQFGLFDRLRNMKQLRLIEPLSYLDFLCLYSQSKLVLSDSGGIQSETTCLKIPCLTLRDTTEFGVTVDQGSNYLVGNKQENILEVLEAVLAGRGKDARDIPLWDGHTAERIRDHLQDRMA